LRAPARRQPAPVFVIGVNLAAIVGLRRERQRLAATTGAKIENLVAGRGSAQQRGELRAFVLSLDKALHKGWFRRERGSAPIGAGHDAQA